MFFVCFAQQFALIRPAAVYGENDPTMTERIRRFLQSSPCIVHFGKWRGGNRWPAASAENVVLACFLGAFHPRAAGKAINVIDAERYTADEFYRHIAHSYFPTRKYRSVTLLFWVGLMIGGFITFISNLFNLKKLFADPSLYALYFVSKNLDFSGSRFESLRDSFNP